MDSIRSHAKAALWPEESTSDLQAQLDVHVRTVAGHADTQAKREMLKKLSDQYRPKIKALAERAQVSSLPNGELYRDIIKCRADMKRDVKIYTKESAPQGFQPIAELDRLARLSKDVGGSSSPTATQFNPRAQAVEKRYGLQDPILPPSELQAEADKLPSLLPSSQSVPGLPLPPRTRYTHPSSTGQDMEISEYDQSNPPSHSQHTHSNATTFGGRRQSFSGRSTTDDTRSFSSSGSGSRGSYMSSRYQASDERSLESSGAHRTAGHHRHQSVSSSDGHDGYASYMHGSHKFSGDYGRDDRASLSSGSSGKVGTVEGLEALRVSNTTSRESGESDLSPYLAQMSVGSARSQDQRPPYSYPARGYPGGAASSHYPRAYNSQQSHDGLAMVQGGQGFQHQSGWHGHPSTSEMPGTGSSAYFVPPASGYGVPGGQMQAYQPPYQPQMGGHPGMGTPGYAPGNVPVYPGYGAPGYASEAYPAAGPSSTPKKMKRKDSTNQ